MKNLTYGARFKVFLVIRLLSYFIYRLFKVVCREIFIFYIYFSLEYLFGLKQFSPLGATFGVRFEVFLVVFQVFFPKIFDFSINEIYLGKYV